MHISHVYHCIIFRLYIMVGNITSHKYPFPILVMKVYQITWQNVSKMTDGINIANQLTLKMYEDYIRGMVQRVRVLVAQA